VCSSDLFYDKETNTFKQHHNFFLCRDFISDALWASRFSTKADIYRFRFDGKTELLNRDRTIFLLQYKQFQKIIDILSELHKIEKQLGWKRTRIIPVEHPKGNVCLVVGSKMWMSSTVHVSIYTLLLRLLAYGQPLEKCFEFPYDVLGGNDCSYMDTLKDTNFSIVKFLANTKQILKGTTFFGTLNHSGFSTDVIHDCMGVVRFAGCLKYKELSDEWIMSEWIKRYQDLP